MKRIFRAGLVFALFALGCGYCAIGAAFDGLYGSCNRGEFGRYGYGYSRYDGPNYGINCGPNCGPRHAVRCAECDSCDSCGSPCDECGPVVHHHCGPITWVLSLLKPETWCGGECVDHRRGYWGEIDNCDPCDSCGNFVGGGRDCGCGGGAPAYRSYGSYPADGDSEIISEEETVGSRPQRPTPAVRGGEPRRAAQPQRAYNR